jgi:hypothetical protein
MGGDMRTPPKEPDAPVTRRWDIKPGFRIRFIEVEGEAPSSVDVHDRKKNAIFCK